MNKKNLILTLCIFGFGITTAADVGFMAPSVNGTSNVNSPELGAIVFDTSTSLFWGNYASPSSPNWTELSSPSQSYASGYFDSEWYIATSDGNFHDFTNYYPGVFYVKNQSSIIVTQSGTNGLGITFTPSSASAAYRVTFKVECTGGFNNPIGLRLYDVDNNIELDETYSSSVGALVLSGIYVPGTTSQVSVLVQGAVASPTMYCEGPTFGGGGTWDIQQVK